MTYGTVACSRIMAISAARPRGIRQSITPRQLHELPGGLVRGVSDEKDAVLREPGLGERLAEHRLDGPVRRERRRRTAQERDVPGFQAQSGRVRGHVRPVLVDHSHDAERHPHSLDDEPVRSNVAGDDFTDRVSQSGDGPQAIGHLADTGTVESQPIDHGGRRARGLRGRHVGRVGLEDLLRVAREQVGCVMERRVLLGSPGDRQLPRRHDGTPRQTVE